jgi:hypothetical protein
LEDLKMENPERWQIAVCESKTVHVHSGTGSLHILTEDFYRFAKDIQEVAGQLERQFLLQTGSGKKGLVQ